MRFCDKLKECRKQKKLSQQALADILNVSQSTVGNWESGSREPDFNTLKVIAEFFGVTIDYLLCREVVEGSSSDEDWQALRTVLEQLPDEKLDEVLAYAEYLAEKGKKNASE